MVEVYLDFVRVQMADLSVVPFVLFSPGGGQRSFRSRVQGQMERQRRGHQDHRERIREDSFRRRGTV